MINRIRMATMILLAASIAGPAFAETAGADYYKAQKCAMCHGADGLATTPVAKSMKVLSFKEPAMIKASDAQFIASTKNGKNKMPKYADKLKPEDVKGLVAYVRTLKK